MDKRMGDTFSVKEIVADKFDEIGKRMDQGFAQINLLVAQIHNDVLSIQKNYETKAEHDKDVDFLQREDERLERLMKETEHRFGQEMDKAEARHNNEMRKIAAVVGIIFGGLELVMKLTGKG